MRYATTCKLSNALRTTARARTHRGIARHIGVYSPRRHLRIRLLLGYDGAGAIRHIADSWAKAGEGGRCGRGRGERGAADRAGNAASWTGANEERRGELRRQRWCSPGPPRAARRAYEVGVVQHIVEDVSGDLARDLPLEILCGTSIGALDPDRHVAGHRAPRLDLRALAEVRATRGRERREADAPSRRSRAAGLSSRTCCSTGSSRASGLRPGGTTRRAPPSCARWSRR